MTQLSGYISSQDVFSPINIPGTRVSIVDGYALKSCDAFSMKDSISVTGSVSAGQLSSKLNINDSAMRISTGASLPIDAQRVVMIEDTQIARMDNEDESFIRIDTSKVEPGDNIREIGSDVKLNQIILEKGSFISDFGGDIGTLIACGIKGVKVTKKCSIGIFSTGNEIRNSGEVLEEGQVYDTNRPCIIELLVKHGYHCIDFGIVRDE